MTVDERFAVLHLRADEAEEGDEVLRGPQGHPLPTAPTVVAIVDRGGVLAATLRDEDGDTLALWRPDSPLTIYRAARGG